VTVGDKHRFSGAKATRRSVPVGLVAFAPVGWRAGIGGGIADF